MVQVWLLVTINILGGLIYGYNTGVIAGALPEIASAFTLDTFQKGLFTASLLFGAAAGSLSGGVIIDKLGRKNGAIITSVFGITGSITSAVAPSVIGMMISRMVLGYGVGLATVVSPTYVSENAPPSQKGFLGTFFQLAITFGIFLSYVVVLPFNDVSHGYKYLFGIGAIPSIAMLVIGIIMPESPAWKIAKSKATIPSESEPLVPKVQHSSSFSLLFSRRESRRAFAIGMLLAVAQQLTGINALMFYAQDIFTKAGIQNAIVPTIGLGLWNFLTTITSTFLVDRLGRRPLLLVGTAIMVVSTILFALSAQFLQHHATLLGISAVLLLLTFVLGFETGEGPLFWVVATELFTPDVQGLAFSLLNLSTWVFTIILSFGFLPLQLLIGQAGCFWIFSGVGVVCISLMYLFLPETKAVPKSEVGIN